MMTDLQIHELRLSYLSVLLPNGVNLDDANKYFDQMMEPRDTSISQNPKDIMKSTEQKVQTEGNRIMDILMPEKPTSIQSDSGIKESVIPINSGEMAMRYEDRVKQFSTNIYDK